ncbi:MAG: TVP38/TMEM64 family protein [Planctomycetes bacterium]|nr:TVP38/TMEM64 family protein [Planctomycetota bacterium]
MNERLGDFLEWVQQMGAWGPFLLGAMYVIACVFFLPGSPLTLGAGFLFGVVKGSLAVVVGSNLGACLAFVIGRTVMRKSIEARIAGNAKFKAIDEAVGSQGFKIVLLTRLSPAFPFNLLNYAYGVTNVPFRKYALASLIGMLPGTAMFVYLGSAAKSLTDILSGNLEGGVGQKTLFGVGLFATVVVTVLVTRLARRALAEAVPASQGD